MIKAMFQLVVASLLVLHCASSGHAADDMQESGSQQDAASQLKGGVEHAEVLPPGDQRLQEGIDFDDSYFKNVRPNNLWVPIPHWLAGVWETRSETQLQIQDLRFKFFTVNIPRTFARSDKWTFGMQADNTGQIWHFVDVPSHRRVTTGKTYEFRHEVSKEFPYTGNDKVVARYRFTAFTVSVKSNKIQRSHQQESLMLFKPDADGNARMWGSLKMFDMKGNPRAMSKNVVPLYRLAEFSPIPIYEGIDMRSSFRDYMVSHNMADKLPKELIDERNPPAQSEPSVPAESDR